MSPQVTEIIMTRPRVEAKCSFPTENCPVSKPAEWKPGILQESHAIALLYLTALRETT